MSTTKDSDGAKHTEVVNCRFEPGVKAQLERLADKDERSLSYMIRKAVGEYLDRN